MIKVLLLLMFSLPVFASNYLVEIADFSCKYCKEAEHYTSKLKYELAKNNDHFIFAPLNFQEDATKVEELFYYTVKSNPSLEKFSRKALFDLKQKHRLKMNTIPELMDWLEIYYQRSNVDFNKVDELFNERNKDFANIKSYIKAERLSKLYKVESTPTFIYISSEGEGTPIFKPEGMSIKDYVDHALDTYKRISKNED